jgi:hypothetical protein
MNGTKLTFNDTTYEFNYFVGTHKGTGKTFDCYGVYVNGEKNTDYVLEKVTQSHGINTDAELYILFWKSFSTYITIKDFSLEEVVKVISYINSQNK